MSKINKNSKRKRFLIILFILCFISFFIIDAIAHKMDSSKLMISLGMSSSNLIHLLGIDFGSKTSSFIIGALIASISLLGLFIFKFKNEDIRPSLVARNGIDILNLVISIVVGFGFIRLSWYMDEKTGWFVVAFIFFVILEVLFNYFFNIKNYKRYIKKYIILSIWGFLTCCYLACLYGVGIIGIAITIIVIFVVGDFSFDNSNDEKFSRYGAWEDGAADARNGIAPSSKNKKYLDGYHSQDY